MRPPASCPLPPTLRTEVNSRVPNPQRKPPRAPKRNAVSWRSEAQAGRVAAEFAPKGQPHNSPGQSKAAPAAQRRPGSPASPKRSPERAQQRTRSGRVLFRPFRALSGGKPVYPGRRCALPWANLFRPFQGDYCRGALAAMSIPLVHGVAPYRSCHAPSAPNNSLPRKLR